MTRIAYVCSDPGVPVFGRKGCSVHVQEVVRALMAEGAEVAIFAARVDGPPPPGLENVDVHLLPPPSRADAAQRELHLLAANDRLAARIEAAGPFDAVYERYALWAHAGMGLARRLGIPGLLEVNAPLIDEQAEHRVLHHRALAQEVTDRAFGAATSLLAVSPAVASYVAGFPAAAGRVQVVPNGVDPGRFDVPSTRAGGDDVAVAFVGTLKPWHGLDALVDAFAALATRIPRARLVIVGDGPERAALEDRAAAAGIASRVTWTGAVAPEQMPSILAGVDIGVAPYPRLPDFYFSPLKVLEYMAAGLPVVASRSGSLPDLVEHGVHGLLYEPSDVDGLAAAIARLAADPPLRRRLGELACAKVRRDHTWRAVARRILEVVEQGVAVAAG
jgi:glycosyltransferase involved in cell wall biosynthesis